MATPIQCPGCKRFYNVAEELAGKQLKCKKCGAVFAVPAPQPAIEDDAEYRVADLLDELDIPAAPALPNAGGANNVRPASDNPYAPPHAKLPRIRPQYRSYDEVPWYRTSSTNSIFALVGWFCFPPLLWWCCINLVTGDVYYNEMVGDELKKWSLANKVIAFIFLITNAAFLIHFVIKGDKF